MCVSVCVCRCAVFVRVYSVRLVRVLCRVHSLLLVCMCLRSALCLVPLDAKFAFGLSALGFNCESVRKVGGSGPRPHCTQG